MARTRTLAIAAFLPFVALGALFPLAAGGQGAVMDGAPLTVRTLAVHAFKSGSTHTKFGKLEFVGGLVMATSKGELGAMSSIRLEPDGEHFISVMDTGFWATGRLLRDADGKLAGIGDFSITEMGKSIADKTERKESMDAEGLIVTPDSIRVSYEGKHRIDTFPRASFLTSEATASEKPLLPAGARLRNNGGLETIVMAPAGSPLAGSLIFVAERSYNKDGNFFAAIQDGPNKGTFAVKRTPPFDVTDGAFLPDGSLLLLERRFGLADGIGCRIRRFSADAIKGKGETIDGEVIFEADYSEQIDNMEGLETFVAADGSTHLLMISDDNHSLLERNLMLEFKLLE